MRDALNFALQGFTGAMVLVSHDRTLLESVCEDFYLVDSGAVEPFSGDLSDYTKWVLDTVKEAKAQEKAEAKAQQPNSAPTLDRKAQKRLEAEFRQRTADIRKTISTSEKVMEQAQEKLHEIETQLSDTALYEDEAKEQLKHILAEQTTLSQRLEEAEITWCEAQEALEAAEQAFAQELANA